MGERAKDDGRRMKITVVLLQRHIAALDHLAVSIRLLTGVALSRADLIGAFIEASRRNRRSVPGNDAPAASSREQIQKGALAMKGRRGKRRTARRSDHVLRPKLKKKELTRLIEEYLDRCYRTRSVPRASEFAASLQRDTKTFRTFIRSIYGVPLATLLRRKRLDKAAFLLRTTNHTVEEIIRRSASGERGSFFRAFRSAFDASPTEYRLSFRASDAPT